jgi:arsenate reductase (glutaredoxin)
MSNAIVHVATLYGIDNCDQVRKAKAWLKQSNVEFAFHDFRKAGLSEELLKSWFVHLPWDTLLNRKGTTWRKLSEEVRLSITDQMSAQALLLGEPTLIKRPVLVFNDKVSVGFSPAVYEHLFPAQQ